jgi:hypothetical protein
MNQFDFVNPPGTLQAGREVWDIEYISQCFHEVCLVSGRYGVGPWIEPHTTNGGEYFESEGPELNCVQGIPVCCPCQCVDKVIAKYVSPGRWTVEFGTLDPNDLQCNNGRRVESMVWDSSTNYGLLPVVKSKEAHGATNAEKKDVARLAWRMHWTVTILESGPDQMTGGGSTSG